MYRRWIVKLRCLDTEKILRFGETIYLGESWWGTVHHARRTKHSCAMCLNPIFKGQDYIRMHTPRDENMGVHAEDRRHLTCIMPSDIESIRVEDISRDE